MASSLKLNNSLSALEGGEARVRWVLKHTSPSQRVALGPSLSPLRAGVIAKWEVSRTFGPDDLSPWISSRFE